MGYQFTVEGEEAKKPKEAKQTVKTKKGVKKK